MKTEQGEYICFIWRRGNRVRHWHWPKKDSVNCENAVDVIQEASGETS